MTENQPENLTPPPPASRKSKPATMPEVKGEVTEAMRADRKKLWQRIGGDWKYFETVIAIVAKFNEITGRECQCSTAGNLPLILRHLREGHGLPQFEAVFNYKYREFKGTENEKYIQIATFCRIDKFEVSLEAARQEYRAKKNAQAGAQAPKSTQQAATAAPEVRKTIYVPPTVAELEAAKLRAGVR